MRILRKIASILVVVMVLLLLAACVFYYSMTPDYDGSKSIPGLQSNVDVYFDTYGIPHIYAANDTDAFRTLGYVHAQDRLWQMELLRRVAKGGLSEVFGADLVGTDKFFLSIGIDQATTETLASIDLNGKAARITQAYLDGINQFIVEGPTPIEFMLTGIEKEPFTLVDVYNSLGYMAFSFAMAHKTDPFLTNIKNKLGVAYLTDLEIDVDPASTWIKKFRPSTFDTIQNNISAAVSDALKGLSLPLFEGSNGWVIGPEKTKNGKVIFANDPHIGFAQPSVWYEAHISTPTYEKYGYHLAGVPFPLLGHNRQLAYGLTMFENDDVDFYYEQTNPANSDQYKTAKGWESYEVVQRTIKVKDGENVAFSFRKTRNGPVLNGIAHQIKEDRPISMSWVYTRQENKVMDALYGMAWAENIKEFQTALPNIHAPGLNVMYGDAKGNIAWFAAAQLYQIPDSVHTKFVLDGSSDAHRPPKYLSFSENPQAINPPWNYVYSANNQPDSIAGMLYPGYYLPENRAKRIVDLLEPKNNWDLQATTAMITDVTSSINPNIIADWVKHIDIKKATKEQLDMLDALIAWKGDYPLESTQATIFHRWEYFFLKNTFEDELGEQMFHELLSTHLHKRLIAPMAKKKESVWWDNVNTGDTVETKTKIVHTSFMEAVASLEKDFGPDTDAWTWGKVHTLEHHHPIGQVEALRSYFNVGPFPIHGSREVINNMYFGYGESGEYKVGSGPSTRRVIDFSDIENSMSILPTGQSGNPFSPHYDDQAELYNDGKFRKMLLNKDEIINTAQSLLKFAPTNK